MSQKSDDARLASKLDSLKRTGELRIPGYLLDCIEKGKISASDVMLLSLIMRLAKSKKGCYATNQWFAERLNRSNAVITRMISKLIRLGFVQKTRGERRSQRLLIPITSEATAQSFELTKMTSCPCYVSSLRQGDNGRPGPDPPTGASFSNGLFAEFNDAPDKVMPHWRMSDLTKANKLIAIKRKQFPGSRVTPSAWSDQIRLLRGDLQDDKRMDEVFDWFCLNWRGRYVPKVAASTAFRKKFLQIEAAMHREKGASYQKRKPTKRVKKIVKRLKQDYKWPKGSAAHLSEMVQQAYAGFRFFLKRLREISKKGSDANAKDRRTARDLLLAFPLTAEEYAERWFVFVNRSIVNWEAWSGRMTPFEFVLNHKELIRDCEDKLRAHGHTDASNRVRRIRELIDAGKE